MDNLAILLCAYNGGKFLREQLDSFVAQSFKNWRLFVYDDQSTDDTKDLVESHDAADKITFISNDTKLGFAKNFLNGLHSTPAHFDFYAISDQDDIWLENKLQRAVAYLKTIDDQKPALYCSRTTLVDSIGTLIGYSPLFQKKPSFRNALVQSIAGGNTMVLNKAACDLVARVERDTEVVSHDWFIYQLVTGAGGVIYYDPHSEILYRQHEANLIGSNNGFCAKLSRIKMLLNNSFKAWNDTNTRALQNSRDLLTQENRDVLDIFVRSRESYLIPRLMGFLKSGIYRQTFLGNVALVAGAMLNKI